MKKSFLLCSLVLSGTLFAACPTLSDMMNLDDQKSTGVYGLNPRQKQTLAQWLVDHGCTKYPSTAATQSNANDNQSMSSPMMTGMLNMNFLGGQFVQFVDGTTYEIRPMDRSISSSWITPASIEIVASQDSNYPWKLTNTLTQSSVYGRQVSASQIPGMSDNNSFPNQPSYPVQPTQPSDQPYNSLQPGQPSDQFPQSQQPQPVPTNPVNPTTPSPPSSK